MAVRGPAQTPPSGHQLGHILMPSADLSNGQYSVASSAVMGGGARPSVLALAGMPGSNGQVGDGAAAMEHSWAGMPYPHLQMIQHTQQDGNRAAADPLAVAVGSKRATDRTDAGGSPSCPLPFLRDVSTVMELHEHWENGMNGQGPLKLLTGAQYRCVRTRYHEIKNFIHRMRVRAARETDGDEQKMLSVMQTELENAKTKHGARMGLPTFVRNVADEHIRDNKKIKSESHSPTGDASAGDSAQ